MSLQVGGRLGSFEVGGPLGAGGMGEVWSATDLRLGRPVALKLLPPALASDPQRVARFEREARLLASLAHPNVATLYGVETIDGRSVLVMELAEGEDLARRLVRGPLPIGDALAIARQVAEALEAAHEKGIVHRDLKPANVMVNDEGRVKVLDFGLAKALGEEDATGSAASDSRSPTLAHTGTLAGVVVGTTAYMSPEQARGRPVDRRTDVWAFGLLLWEMLTGRRLFDGETVSDTVAAVLEREIDWSALPPATPHSVRRVLRLCLVRDPRQRLHDIADARIELADPGEPVLAAKAAGRRSRLARALPWVVALVALALAATRWLGGRGTATPSPQLCFSVSPGAPGAFDGYPALSPDGRWLAYVLLPEKGPSTLWLHSFESGTGRVLPGTDDAAEPFWSPDGRSLAFFARGALKKVDLSAGVVQELCAAPDPRGGSWGSRGQILFGAGAVSGLFLVSADGGAPQALTHVDGERGEQTHRYPCFMPDGRHYVFVILGTREVGGLYFGDTAGAAYRKLTSAFTRAAYDGRGYLVYLRENALVAQRFDPERGTLSGEPLPLTADRVGDDRQRGGESWFAAGGAVAAYRPEALQNRHLVWLDRSGALLGEVTSPGIYLEPMLSRDGTRVVSEVETSAATRIDFWIYDAASLDRGQRLAFDTQIAFGPVWSPDGKWIVYTPRGPGVKRGTLARRAADGSGGEEVLISGGPERFTSAWSPDGKTIVFEQYAEQTGADLWTLALDAPRAARPLLDGRGNETHARFSPDGRLLAYTSDETGIPQVFVQTFPRSGAKWQVSSAGGDSVSWRSDGRELYYVGADRVLYAVPVRATVTLELGRAQPLFQLHVPPIATTGSRVNYDPAPDGRRFLVNWPVPGEIASTLRVLVNWSPQPSLPR